MTVQGRIEPAFAESTNINLTEIMVREGIESITNYLRGTRFSVMLTDGRFGVGKTVGEALAKATAPDAENIKRAA